MSLTGKKVWIDIEEPKNAIMFQGLIKMFESEGITLYITARDFDSTYPILDDAHINYKRVGRHGGEKLTDKLQTYIDRLNDLLPHVQQFKPDFFVTFGSVEGTRIAFGLQIPSIGFSDEPRSMHVSKLLFPFIDKLITPMCIPIEKYIALHAHPEKIIRYYGIDEIAWISDYHPNPKVLSKFQIEPGKFLLLRSEPSFATYFIDELKPEETLLAQIFPPLFKQYPEYTYFLLVRTEKQERWLSEKLQSSIPNPHIRITRYLPNIVDLCFYAAIVISGGGTIVRESSLLNVPSIEFFPGESAPQELFLQENGFPMYHIKDPKEIVAFTLNLLTSNSQKGRFDESFQKKIRHYENPNQICFNYVKQQLLRMK